MRRFSRTAGCSTGVAVLLAGVAIAAEPNPPEESEAHLEELWVGTPGEAAEIRDDCRRDVWHAFDELNLACFILDRDDLSGPPVEDAPVDPSDCGQVLARWMFEESRLCDDSIGGTDWEVRLRTRAGEWFESGEATSLP